MPEITRHMTVATAGHIDHGKTALVRALTGMETDRLEAEKRRGITIELGFAFLGDHITLIDVPGHERFLKTMMAGVSTVDLALLVVAADDGIMPQTKEHLAIVHLLGIPRLFVVLTKVAGLDPAWLNLVEDEIRAILPPIYRSSSRFFSCDSLAGKGIEELKAALLDLSQQLPPRTGSDLFRLPMDRLFSLKGYGTVATGTIIGGRVAVGDVLWAMPQKLEVRVRGLQSHGRDRSSLALGDRAALNIAGDKVSALQRGDWLCQLPLAGLPTAHLDVSLQILPETPPLKHRDRLRLHLGTGETLGRVLLFDSKTVFPGEEVCAQIVLENPVMALRGDHFIIRRYSPLLTLGGGVVLDPLSTGRHLPEILPLLKALRTASAAEALSLKVRLGGAYGLSVDLAQSFLNTSRSKLEMVIQSQIEAGILHLLGKFAGGLLVADSVLAAARRRLLQHVAEYHQRHPDHLGIPPAHLISDLTAELPPALIERALEELLRSELVEDRGYLHAREHQVVLSPDLVDASAEIESLLRNASFNPPSVETMQKQLSLTAGDLQRVLHIMSLQGRVVRLHDGLFWSTNTLHEAWLIVQHELDKGQGKSTSQLRAALGCPRRFAVALLEYFDSRGKTQRQGEQRVAGPNFHEAI